MEHSFLNDHLVPSIQDRKRAIFSQKEFMSAVNCIVESVGRQAGGTHAHFTANLPFAVRGVYAASLTSLTMPMNFGTNLTDLSFDVKYTSVTAFPGNFAL